MRTELFDMGATKKTVGLTETQMMDLWDAYPKHVGKRTTWVAMERAGKRATFYAIRDGLLAYVTHLKREQTERRFIKNPATWFNGDHWLDEYEMNTRDPKWPPRYRPMRGGPSPSEWIEHEIDNGRDPWAK